MPRWTHVTDVKQLAVGQIVRDTSPHCGYIGGVVQKFDEAVEVAWLKWDPRIEQPMLSNVYASNENATFEQLVLVEDAVDPDDNDTTQDLLMFVEQYLERMFGRIFTLEEFIAVMDKYAQ